MTILWYRKLLRKMFALFSHVSPKQLLFASMSSVEKSTHTHSFSHVFLMLSTYIRSWLTPIARGGCRLLDESKGMIGAEQHMRQSRAAAFLYPSISSFSCIGDSILLCFCYAHKLIYSERNITAFHCIDQIFTLRFKYWNSEIYWKLDLLFVSKQL